MGRADTLLIDGDISLIEACMVCYTEIVWDDEVTTIHVDNKEVRTIISNSVENHLKTLNMPKDTEVIFALTGPNNFRKGIYPDYKGNRQTSKRPVGFASAKRWLKDTYRVEEWDGLEADDILGIMATSKGGVIVSDDKDMLQIPTTIYQPSSKRVVDQDETAGLYFHMYQTLVGDRVDNYPGCTGVGDVTATRLLKSMPKEKWWDVVLETFLEKGHTEEFAYQMARVSKILQAKDYNKRKKEPKLWQSVSSAASLAKSSAPRKSKRSKTAASQKKTTSTRTTTRSTKSSQSSSSRKTRSSSLKGMRSST